MGLKDKFEEYDAKISSKFHKTKDGMKKVSWLRVILLWIVLIVLVSVLSIGVSSLFGPPIVDAELTPIDSQYDLNYSSDVSNTYFIYSKYGSAPNKDAYIIDYKNKLKLDLDISKVPHSDYLEKILESYYEGDNEYNATVDVVFKAYDTNNKLIETDYIMSVADDNMDMKLSFIDLILSSSSKYKIDFNKGKISIISTDKGNDISEKGFNDSLKKINHINGSINIVNNHIDSEESGFYNYTLTFTIPKSSINIKKV